MINKVILVGNLGADPETKTTQSGMVVCSLRIATTERKKDASGNWADYTEWHRVTVFGKTAENAQKFLKKGRQVYVEGKLRTTKYQDKDGKERYSTDVIADDVKFLGGEGGAKRENQSRVEDWEARKAGPSKSKVGVANEGGGFDDDSVPF